MKPSQVDLTAAVARVHDRAPRQQRVRSELAQTPDELLLAAGDDPERASFFDYLVTEDGARIDLAGAALPDYRTRSGKRTHRLMLTVPPSLRARIEKLAPGQPWSTALIALADFAARELESREQGLVVRRARDEQAIERKQVRRLLRQQGLHD